ncbi:DUF971 domain-containing protein [Gilvimarinus sp. SDUM040013]|uniref:DUF971 domain-containing protein n=1 Tax=Gilvimarinus gilvus TaxID=3058038 RepID=A0ABU4RYY9_9GAMM|nr:DUF971 domain-containing protein [Gilvimarinus sp. SDUM040013]MDO3387397.1 DUF971 domain-containing protein [Gilvimarinus sp. SDUM040013]MDX6849874.1 DUF971 domain-containing protein [Gilvimarinus sp. SDUM040013]
MTPTKVKLLRQSAELELSYGDTTFRLDAEFLRVHSPSAEVRGHGAGNEKLQTGKRHVQLQDLEAVGNYGIKLVFDDGHDSGIYTWALLYELCKNHDQYWGKYLTALEQAGQSRDPDVQPLKFHPVSD